MKWRDYQEKSAAFFRRLGFQSLVEEPISGARGVHVVDVLVTGKSQSIPFVWLVECKHWKTNITKEKALALIAIVQDVGADRGFLLSEKGFQPGAIRTVRKTNVTLTKLANLQSDAQDSLANVEGEYLHRRYREVTMLPYTQLLSGGPYASRKQIKSVAKLGLVEFAIGHAMCGIFPVNIELNNSARGTATCWDEFFLKVKNLLDECEREFYAGLEIEADSEDQRGNSSLPW